MVVVVLVKQVGRAPSRVLAAAVMGVLLVPLPELRALPTLAVVADARRLAVVAQAAAAL